MKLAARNTEAEATIDNLNAKLVQIEKAKAKRLCFSLHCCIDNLSLIKVSSHFINFSLYFGFCLFNLYKLCIQIVDSCFSFSISCCKLHLGHLKLFSLGNSINF